MVDTAFAVAEKATIKGNRVDINARARTARALFERQPQTEQKKWEKKSKEQHKQMLREWEDAINRPASKDPEARQR